MGGGAGDLVGVGPLAVLCSLVEDSKAGPGRSDMLAGIYNPDIKTDLLVLFPKPREMPPP